MRPFLAAFGNPSSSHAYGRPCKAAVDEARARVAALVGAHNDEIYFTSCGTEADTWCVFGELGRRPPGGLLACASCRPRQAALPPSCRAIWGAVMAARRRCRSSPAFVPHVVTSCVEHPAVLQTLNNYAELGLLTYTAVPVDGQGLVDPAAVEAALTEGTVLLTLMHSNNETGALQPVAAAAAAARARGVLVHVDAAQSLGKVPVDARQLGADMLTIVG